MDKKAQNITITTIIMIVLALIVLVVLVVGFTGGWSNLWGRMSGFFGGANVDSVVQACNVACTTEAQNDWCTRTRKVNFGKDDSRNGDLTCEQLSAPAMEAGLEGCPGITCP